MSNNQTTADRLFVFNDNGPKLRWKREAPSRVGFNPDKFIYAQGKAHDYLIKQIRDGWFYEKVVGYALTIDPGTYSPKTFTFDRQGDAKVYAQEFEATNKR